MRDRLVRVGLAATSDPAVVRDGFTDPWTSADHVRAAAGIASSALPAGAAWAQRGPRPAHVQA